MKIIESVRRKKELKDENINKNKSFGSVNDFEKQSGFTLIEMLVVVVVLGIIAGIVYSRFQAAVMKSNEASAVSALKLISSAETALLANSSAPVSFDELISQGAIDNAFADDDGDPNTGARSGYKFQITIYGNSYVLSAIPKSSGVFGSGRTRLGTNESNQLFMDENNLTTHYSSVSDLTAGTSVPYTQN